MKRLLRGVRLLGCLLAGCDGAPMPGGHSGVTQDEASDTEPDTSVESQVPSQISVIMRLRGQGVQGGSTQVDGAGARQTVAAQGAPPARLAVVLVDPETDSEASEGEARPAIERVTELIPVMTQNSPARGSWTSTATEARFPNLRFHLSVLLTDGATCMSRDPASLGSEMPLYCESPAPEGDVPDSPPSQPETGPPSPGDPPAPSVPGSE